jgi:hypothetical protein
MDHNTHAASCLPPDAARRIGQGPHNVKPLGLDLAAHANASPLLHQEKAAEQVRRDVEPVKAARVLRQVDAVKFNQRHGFDRLAHDRGFRESSGQIAD